MTQVIEPHTHAHFGAVVASSTSAQHIANYIYSDRGLLKEIDMSLIYKRNCVGHCCTASNNSLCSVLELWLNHKSISTGLPCTSGCSWMTRKMLLAAPTDFGCPERIFDHLNAFGGSYGCRGLILMDFGIILGLILRAFFGFLMHTHDVVNDIFRHGPHCGQRRIVRDGQEK
jgi:hypothetical protein